MPISNFEGNTFVAFTDISGFKVMMKDKDRAWKALDKLYSKSYHIIHRQNQNGSSIKVEGLFISDCGILFTRKIGDANEYDQLNELLKVIKEINKDMVKSDFMLTTSVAYGMFRYNERIEFHGIEKNPIYGQAYLSAFLDNEVESPKIQPGQCRIVRRNLPSNVIDILEHLCMNNTSLHILKRVSNKHYYFYWMVDNIDEVDEFVSDYSNAYNLKYAGMLKALKRNQLK